MKRRRIVRTAEFMVETEEKAVVRRRADAGTARLCCPGCGYEVEMVTPERAARMAGVGPRTIYRWVESGKLHFIERDDRLWVCTAQLFAVGG